jgi:2-iminobutanoate/2-iminopropanoate deaminase
MSRRRTFEIPGIAGHSAPIPMAAQLGTVFRSSGIPPTDPETGGYPASGEDQVRMAFRNAGALLGVAGLSAADVVYMDVYLADNGLRAAVNESWLAWYPDAHDRPARHVTVRALPGAMQVQLQIEAVATEDGAS